MKSLTLALLAILPTVSCIGSFSSGVRVDGVRLEEKHVETLEIGEWAANGLTLSASIGDVNVVRAAGPNNRVLVTVFEKYAGDAWAAYEDGQIVTRTSSGEPSAIADATIHVATPLPRLVVSTGMGDVVIRDVEVAGDLSGCTGMGDVLIERTGSTAALAVASGMGDIELVRISCARLDASTGMGDVDLLSVQAGVASLSSGLGDLKVRSSTFERLDASSGLGDVDCIEVSYERGDLDTGLGSVRQR